MKGKTVCRLHGGAGGRPPKHGKYSGLARLHAAYRPAAGRPIEFDLKPGIALIVFRIQQRFHPLNRLGGTVDQEEILDAVAAIRQRADRTDLGHCAAGLAILEAAAEKTNEERKPWKRMRKDMNAERRLVEAEWRWKILNQQMVPVEEV